VAGDFMNLAYIEKWRQIVAASKRTRFYAYTRSWRDPALLPALRALAKLPNMQLWLSEDRETGPAPKVGIPIAFMVIDDFDETHVPARASLVFREVGKTDIRVIKKMNGVQVCPYENGIDYTPAMTCARCGICWKKELANRLRS
jgi:hypothetical protein